MRGELRAAESPLRTESQCRLTAVEEPGRSQGESPFPRQSERKFRSIVRRTKVLRVRPLGGGYRIAAPPEVKGASTKTEKYFTEAE